MKTTSDASELYRQCRDALQSRNQQHVLQFWDQLSTTERKRLLSDIESIPWDVLDEVIPTHVLRKPEIRTGGRIEPATVYPAIPTGGNEALYRQAVDHGRALLRAGKVAAFTVAGGQGTRLGFDGPKGALRVTPVREATLFELFGEMVVAARRLYGHAIPWYVMTSPANHEATLEFFQARQWLGLPESDVRLFSQGVLPALDFSGRLLLEGRDRLALAPDGHGGSLQALARSGALADMRARGVELISYFQVDNPLVKPFDPLFIGLHDQTGSEMSTKVLPKADDLERVGNVCMVDGTVSVIEYSDLPDELAHARNPDGTRRFNAGNAAIHAFQVAFVERITTHQLPYRRADKAVAHVDAQGNIVKPSAPNAVKLETFVFDVLPLAANPLVLEIERAEEFSPIKNATGADSLATSRRDQISRSYRWLEQAGIPVPRRSDGTPNAVVEIGPLFALDADDVRNKRERILAITADARVALCDP